MKIAEDEYTNLQEIAYIRGYLQFTTPLKRTTSLSLDFAHGKALTLTPYTMPKYSCT